MNGRASGDDAVLMAAAAALRMSRRHVWRTAPLDFDAVPDDQPQSLGVFV